MSFSRIGRERAVGFEPFPSGSGRHRDIFGLLRREPALDFNVLMPRRGKMFLPTASAWDHAPDEHLSTDQSLRGSVNQSVSLAIERRDPRPFFGGAAKLKVRR